jgi:formylglycine-generating enzyme required for sulfatase activity
MSQRTAALAKGRGLDVEAVEVEGNHGTCVPGAINQSMAFFQKNSPAQQDNWQRESVALPKTLELELGGGIKMQMARIEPGRFLMGSPSSEAGRRDDEEQHEVEITKPYGLGMHLVTQSQYRQIMGTKPSHFSHQGDGREQVSGLNTADYPVENVSWDDAMDFCRILSLLPAVRDKGWVVNLPTEAEWEYACRTGAKTAFSFGDALSSQQANFNGNHPYGGAVKGLFLGRTTKVGSYAANAWGVYDMHGQVLQWCKDWYDKDYYGQGDKRDPVGPASGRRRVARGGSWLADGSRCRAASRDGNAPPEVHYETHGFRVVVRLRAKTSQ